MNAPYRPHVIRSLLAMSLAFVLGACEEAPLDASEILEDVDAHIGKRIRMKASFRAGIRCKLNTEDGEWKTYCRDCQVCRGPYVVNTASEDGDAWPMVLAGTWKLRDIRCKGPLNEVDCYPLEVGREYIVEGVLERSTPPKLFVDGFSLVQDRE